VIEKKFMECVKNIRCEENCWVREVPVVLKVRNNEWVGARPDVGSTVLLWT
jgi:hypothetical protein